MCQGCHCTLRAGSKSYNTFGCKGASNHVDFSYYPNLPDARRGLMEDKGVTKILGVEIVDDAVPIESHPFDGNTAFIMGNEGEGMTPNQKAICDGFVYIRQHGPGTASLNVAVAASIVMHHFALWVRFLFLHYNMGYGVFYSRDRDRQSMHFHVHLIFTSTSTSRASSILQNSPLDESTCMPPLRYSSRVYITRAARACTTRLLLLFFIWWC